MFIETNVNTNVVFYNKLSYFEWGWWRHPRGFKHEQEDVIEVFPHQMLNIWKITFKFAHFFLRNSTPGHKDDAHERIQSRLKRIFFSITNSVLIAQWPVIDMSGWSINIVWDVRRRRRRRGGIPLLPTAVSLLIRLQINIMTYGYRNDRY